METMNASGVGNLILTKVSDPFLYCKLVQNVRGGKFNEESYHLIISVQEFPKIAKLCVYEIVGTILILNKMKQYFLVL
jgi:hypothetical protein